MKTTIYLPTAEGLNIVTGNEGSWRGTTALRGMQLQCVAVDPADPNRVYCGTFGHGVQISHDGGASWHCGRELDTARITALSAAPSGMIYAGTEPSGVWQSFDQGERWTPLSSLLTLPSASTWSFPPRPETHHVQAILGASDPPLRLHVAIEAGALLRTDDGGSSWQDRVAGGPYDTHTLIADPRDGKHLFSAAGDGCFESGDGGASWEPLMAGLQQTYCWSIAVHPSSPETLLLTASEFAASAHNPHAPQSFVYRRVGHEAWHLAMDGLSMLPQVRIPVIVAGQREADTFYLATESRVYRSIDGGISWSGLPIDWEGGQPIARHSLSMALSQTEK